MFILTIAGKEKQGAYSVPDGEGDQILYLFEEEDYPEMHVLEVEDEIMIKTCESHGYNYTVITSNDIVIPPNNYDFI